ATIYGIFISSLCFFLCVVNVVCPDKVPGLQPWMPGFSEAHHVTIGFGRKVLLTSSATIHSIEILNGGKLVIADTNQPIFLRAKHILIGNKGELHIGSPDCPYKGNLTIGLYGSDEGHTYFGRKYLGVGTGGTLEVHGEKKLSWTFLNKTLHPGEGNENSYQFERSWGNRGIIVHVVEPKTGEVLHSDRFDTYRSKDESRRLAQYVEAVENGQILAMVVNDEGSNNLEDTARKALVKLGSRHFHRLGFRHPWSFITVKGDASSAVEDHAIYQGTKASSEARSVRSFRSGYGEHFTITTLSQWVQEAEWTEWFDRDDERGSGDWEKLSDLHKAFPERLCSNPLDIEAETLDGIPANMTGEVFSKFDKNYGFVCLNKDQSEGICHNYRVRFLCGKLVRPQASISIDIVSNCTILELADEAQGWRPGDRLVVASTDYSMHQAEEFSVLPCPTCSSNQVKVEGKPAFLHMGELVDGVDMRAEVGLLSRNILIRGEMEAGCYGSESCKFFSFDTFGGHLKVERGFKAVHVQGVELMHMGQQSMGHYPVHFHMNLDVDQRGGYDPPTYVKDLSIHHSFSRCVTIHGSNGLLVKDVVGYDVLGHCFFTEDGPEERNTFEHCLGLKVKAGTLLPSDRDSKMCRDITDGAFPGYIAKPRQDCSATSTFWIANPNNNLIDCAAAGSEETGFWFLFHNIPTGPSEGMYSPGTTEHTPMGRFINNRAHSNYRAGMILDNGVKTTQANAKDKRPYLSLVGARYGPHQDSDPFKPRVPALIHHFVAYKNQDHGAWLRGGDVWLDDCQFADNGIGLTLASGGTFPDDDGSRQEVKNSLFVGESENRGMVVPDSRIWGPGGLDHSGRTLPRGVDFPIRGMQIYDGPINVQNCTFRKYVALDGRHTSAFAFRLNNSWQSCPNNNVTDITFDSVPITSRVFFGEPGPWFSEMQMDGDKTTVFHDVDGSVSEYPGAFLVKEDNWLLRHPDCIDVPDWRAAICSGRFAQVSATLRLPKKHQRPHTHTQTHTPAATNIQIMHCYEQTQPHNSALYIPLKILNDWITVGFCYPKGTNFTIISDIHNRLTKQTRKTGVFMRTTQREKMGHTHQTRGYYYWDEDTGFVILLYYIILYLLCYRLLFFLIIVITSFMSVPCASVRGRCNYTFSTEVSLNPQIIKMVILKLMITSKGKLVTKGPWTKILEKLGAEQNVKLKDKLAFVGFKGSFRPDWVRLSVDEERAKIHQVLPVPIVRMMKL
uniref:hyaluronoglucosaminidase n=1 Tax=Astyanax mexicanus TaxID=7994 RepID=A0A8B9K669_ASTMX